jgi:hydroxymethylbilane synthase
VTVRLAAPGDYRSQVRKVLGALADHDIDATLVPPGAEVEIDLLPAEGIEGGELDDVVILALPEPRDALAAFEGRTATLESVPEGGTVGLSGPLRRQMLGVHRPDLRASEIEDFHTVQALMERGEIDAWIASVQQIRSAGMADWTGEIFEPTSWATSAGRGALMLRADPAMEAVWNVIAALDDAGARAALIAELAVLEGLGVDRRAPVGVMARPHGELLRVRAMVPAAAGRRLVRAEVSGVQSAAVDAGRRTAALLLERGAAELLSLQATR